MLDRLKQLGFDGEIRRGVSLREMTSLRIGGSCEYLIEPSDPFSLKLLLELLAEEEREAVVIGGGTNLLVSDEGVQEVVVSLRGWKKTAVVEATDEYEVVFVQPGVALQWMVETAAQRGLTGLEGLVGIPGTIGGAVSGNAGSYGYEIGKVVDRVTVITRSGRMETLQSAEVGFGYRCTGLEGVIVGVHLRLLKDDPERVKSRCREFLQHKKQSQPLGEASAGCVFKNPPGKKAGQLIEEAGLKGTKVGQIQVSQRHANFFINLGRGTSRDFIDLMHLVQEEVYRRFSISLEPEIRFVGRFNGG